MCLVVFTYNAHPRYKFIFAANRDEFYNRPSMQAHYWDDNPSLLAGKDLQAGGSWLGITKKGRFAAITNYRDMTNIKENSPSRGLLPLNFLNGTENIKDYFKSLNFTLPSYNGFNLIAGEIDDLYYFSNVPAKLTKINPGIHGLSNAFINTPWPKVNKSKEVLSKFVHRDNILPEELLELLSDTNQANDESLPDTGIGLEWERILSSVFIRSDKYGTRSSTAIIIDIDNNVQFMERTFFNGKLTYTDKIYNFKLNIS